MSNAVDFAKPLGVTIPPDWRWKTNDDLYLRPIVMETRHLHHTLVMIWHHTMPENARVRSYYRRYSFGPFYTAEYMRQAVTVMAAELSTRTDMKPEWMSELRKMREYLFPTRGEITALKRLAKYR